MKIKKIIVSAVAIAVAAAALTITVIAADLVGGYNVYYSSSIGKTYALSTSTISADPTLHEVSLIINAMYRYRDENNEIHPDSKYVNLHNSGCSAYYTTNKSGGEMISVYANHLFYVKPNDCSASTGSFNSNATR